MWGKGISCINLPSVAGHAGKKYCLANWIIFIMSWNSDFVNRIADENLLCNNFLGLHKWSQELIKIMVQSQSTGWHIKMVKQQHPHSMLSHKMYSCSLYNTLLTIFTHSGLELTFKIILAFCNCSVFHIKLFLCLSLHSLTDILSLMTAQLTWHSAYSVLYFPSWTQYSWYVFHTAAVTNWLNLVSGLIMIYSTHSSW